MGDRCEMRIWVAPQDAARFAEDQGFYPVESEPDSDPRRAGLVELDGQEINYGGEFITVLDVPWIGVHGAGGSYPACQVYCAGDEQLQTWPLGANDGAYALDADEEGRVDAKELARLQDFIRGYRETERAAKARAQLARRVNPDAAIRGTGE